jgi:amino acid transporter
MQQATADGRPRAKAPSIVNSALAQASLGQRALSQIGLSSAAPLLVIAGLVTSGISTTGMTSIPIAFLALALVLGVWVQGYAAMAARIRNAGSLYTYVSLGLGRHAGLSVAMIAFVTYSFMQIALYGIVGPTASSLIETVTGLAVPWWHCSLIAWAIVAVLGVRPIDLNSTVLGLMLAGELIFVTVFIVTALAHPANGTVSFASFNPSTFSAEQLLTVLVIAYAGFVGIEAVTSYSEEAKNPKRTVRRAIYTVLAMMAVLYGLASWALTVTVGENDIVAAARAQGPDLMFNITGHHLGSHIQTAGKIMFLTSMLAGLIAFHHNINRYVFSLGREGVFSRRFAATSASGAPYNASALQSVTGLLAIAVVVATGADPLVWLFFILGLTGSFGVLIATTAASVAVIAYFRKHPTTDVSRWQRLIAPTIAAVLMFGILIATVIYYDVLLGVAPGSPVRWIMPASFVVAAAGGVALAFVMRSRRRDAYDRIGRSGPADQAGTDPDRRPPTVSGC